MADAADDLEALFDEIASQRGGTADPAPQAEVAAVEPAIAETSSEAAAPTTVEASRTDQSDKPMYERLGGIVRMLHDSLRELGYDRSLTDVAHQINDAQGRLEHVAALTEQAANKVLNTVDTCMPEQEQLGKQARDIEARWEQLFAGKLSIEEFKALAGDARQFATLVVGATDAEKARLLDIMMAQDFQDITGQLIKKIVGITSTAERELAQLLRDNAPPEVKAQLAAEKNAEKKNAEKKNAEKKNAEKQPVDLMQGPSAPGTALAQDDVDSLLADLGF